MKSKISLVSRILLGLVFTIFGTNGLMMFLLGHGFLPLPPPPESIMPFMVGLDSTGYLFPSIKIFELVAGIFLLTGNYVRLALIILAPIVYNIIGIHLFLEPSGLPMAIAIGLLMFILFMTNIDGFREVLKRK